MAGHLLALVDAAADVAATNHARRACPARKRGSKNIIAIFQR